jgi:hypothetical protein
MFAAVHESGCGPSRQMPMLGPTSAFGALRKSADDRQEAATRRLTRSGIAKLAVNIRLPSRRGLTGTLT